LIGSRGDRAAGLAVLATIDPDSSDADRNRLADSIAASVDETTSSARGFWSARLRIPILLAFLVAFFNQMSGINAILYFAPRIFELTGLTSQAALLQSVGIGLTNLVFTFVGLYLIDRLGRKTLLLIGSFGYIFSLGLCSYTFFAHQTEFAVAASATRLSVVCQTVADAPEQTGLDIELSKAEAELRGALASGYGGPTSELPATTSVSELQQFADRLSAEASQAAGLGGGIVLFCIFAFIAAHAVGQGAVIWVLISEIFPNLYRASGQSLGSFTHWIFAALLTLFFPKMVSFFPPGFVFGFFCFMMVLQLVWVLTMVPETKGVPLEELQRRLGVEK
jgi:MFS family permease